MTIRSVRALDGACPRAQPAVLPDIGRSGAGLPGLLEAAWHVLAAERRATAAVRIEADVADRR